MTMTMMMEPSKSSLRFIAYQRFFTAVRSGDLDSLKQIVGEQPSDVSDLMSLQTDAGETALYIAADNNLEEVFRYLVKLCDLETVKIRSKSDLNAFHLAAKKGHLGIVKDLLVTWPELCKVCDSSNTSPLYSAAVKDHLDVVNAILDVDVSSLRIVRKNEKTSLHTAARYGLLDMVKVLIHRDPGIVCIKDKKGQTALHMAVKGQSTSVVEEILLADCSILNERDKKGNTAVHVATRKSRPQIISLLLNYISIDVNIINNQHETAMDLADKLPYGESALEIKEALTEAGAKHARHVGQMDEAMELKRTVSDIKHEVHSQLIQNEKTNRRVSGIAKELRKIHREAVQNTTNSVTVVAVLFASIAFLAIFNLPGQYIKDGAETGKASIAGNVGFQVFCLLNATSLFISLAVVVVQITLVAWDTQAQKQLVSIVNKLMWDEYESEIDIDDLEKEAKFAVKELSTSLSRQLTIEDETDEKRDSRKQKRKKTTSKDIPDHLLPKVAIVGRPNVGKSALFNRLVGGNRAIVVDEPGVTRDRLYGRSFWGEHEFMVVDTGGVVTVSKSQANVMEDLAISTTIGMDGIPLASREAAVARMPSMIEKQATAAVEESSVIIFLVDGQAGLTAADVEIADWLRRNYSNKCIILAVNKCESPRKGIMQASEFWSLGFSPLPISAISGTGTGELLDLVCSKLGKVEGPENLNEEETYIPAIAIVGRPNVGKSSILNALVGEDRTIVSPISGTTRDAIDTEFVGPDGQKFLLIDTAGIRRRAAVASSGSVTEALSVNRAFRGIRRSDVVALVIEAMACITEQDYRIAERIEKEGKGCLIVVNKWDTIPNKNQQTATYYEQDVREKLRLLHWAPIVYSTAIAGHNVEKIIVAASTVEKERSRRLGTSILNQVVREALAFKPPPRTRGGKRGRVYYCTQAAIRPPTFVFFVNDSNLFPETYRRYMEKQLRTDAGFSGTPIRLLWRSRRKMEKDEVKGATRPQINLSPGSGKLAVAT